MFFLPKGIPLAENIVASKIDLPAVLGKLRNSGFNGYAQLDIPSAAALFLYVDGRMIAAVFKREGNKILHDLEAIQTTIEGLVLNRDGFFRAYRFSREITYALVAQSIGDVVLAAQEMKQIDFKGVLEKIKTERMNACLKVYTDVRSGLIFYCDGSPVGFYDDISQEIGLSQTEVQKIAGLPAARIDVKSTSRSENASTRVDLHNLIDIAKVWSFANENVFSSAAVLPVVNTNTKTNVNNSVVPSTKKLEELQANIIGIAVTYIGKLGQILTEKELAKIGDPINVLIPGNLEELLTALEKGSKMLTSSVKIRQMQEAIRLEVARCR
jgi:uncharacterized protein YqgV (UPF0045/DUF77 family)